MPTTISDLFTIDINETIAAGASKTVANPGRAFRVIQALITGANGANILVKKNSGSGAQVADGSVATGDLNAFPSLIGTTLLTPAEIDALTLFSATDNIYVVGATATTRRVTLICMAADGQALTVT